MTASRRSLRMGRRERKEEGDEVEEVEVELDFERRDCE